jgi:hypothetical protein
MREGGREKKEKKNSFVINVSDDWQIVKRNVCHPKQKNSVRHRTLNMADINDERQYATRIYEHRNYNDYMNFREDHIDPNVSNRKNHYFLTIVKYDPETMDHPWEKNLSKREYKPHAKDGISIRAIYHESQAKYVVSVNGVVGAPIILKKNRRVYLTFMPKYDQPLSLTTDFIDKDGCDDSAFSEIANPITNFVTISFFVGTAIPTSFFYRSKHAFNGGCICIDGLIPTLNQ